MSRALLYRHFDSKRDLYLAALDDVHNRVREATQPPDVLEPERLDALVATAHADPDGFRLLFRHASREPEFREFTDTLRLHMAATAEKNMRSFLPDDAQRRWVAALLPPTIIESIIAWLDAGAPDPDHAPEIIRQMQRGIVSAVRTHSGAKVKPSRPG